MLPSVEEFIRAFKPCHRAANWLRKQDGLYAAAVNASDDDWAWFANIPTDGFWDDVYVELLEVRRCGFRQEQYLIRRYGTLKPASIRDYWIPIRL